MNRDIMTSFGDAHILVVGDVVLDNYVYGDVERINPEAPVPVLRVMREESKLGGTANVAANIKSLGGSCTLVGQIGNDEPGRTMKTLMEVAGIKSRLVVRDDVRTITKTRIVARRQQVIRVDREDPKPLNNTCTDEIIDYIRRSTFDLIVVSDYAKGVVNGKLMKFIKSLGVKVIVDPKPSNMELYKGVYAITPNIRESYKMCEEENIIKRGRKLADEMQCNVIITRGEDGASLFTLKGDEAHIQAKKREVFDVVGAGDTFVAAVSLAVSAGAGLPDACSFANTASGIVIEKVGTSVVTTEEITEALCKGENIKIRNIQELKVIVEEARRKGGRIVFTNGCFDVLHTGHAKLLKEAKSHGDVLILGLNTDESVRRLKGPSRPLNNERDRADMLAHLPYVNYIVLFNDATPCELIKELKPEIHVKGGDYDPDDYEHMPEAKVVNSYGGRVVVIDYVSDKSSTRTIEMLKKLGN